MTLTPRRRAFAALLVGVAIALTGCTVPGQAGAAGVAAVLDETVVTNEHVNELTQAWRNDAAEPTGRSNVITLELMREPLLQQMAEYELPYHRSQAEQQAQLLLRMQGEKEPPSEALVDAVEGAFLVAIFYVSPNLQEALQNTAYEVEANAVLSPRSGQFSADAFLRSLTPAFETANNLAMQGSPVWAMAFNRVNGLVENDAPWSETHSASSP